MSLPDKTVPWDDVAALRSGDSRRAVFESIAESPGYAAEIADREDMSRDTVTKRIHWLKNKELIECLTPDRPHCRIYGITERGRKVFKSL